MNTMEFSAITKESLAKAFESAAIECEITADNNEVYVKSGGGVDFGLWVEIDDENKSIQLYTNLKCKEGAPTDKLSAFAYSLSETYRTVKFSSNVYDDGGAFLNGSYHIYTNFGILIPQLIYTIKMFSEIFLLAVKDGDSDDVFFS
jgi:hypothetical protein